MCTILLKFSVELDDASTVSLNIAKPLDIFTLPFLFLITVMKSLQGMSTEISRSATKKRNHTSR